MKKYKKECEEIEKSKHKKAINYYNRHYFINSVYYCL